MLLNIFFLLTGFVRGWNRHDIGDNGMGFGSSAEPSQSHEKGTCRNRRDHRKRQALGRIRSPEVAVPPPHRPGHSEAVPAGTHAGPTRVNQGLHGQRLPRATWHNAVGECVVHPTRPEVVGGPERLQTGPVRGGG